MVCEIEYYVSKEMDAVYLDRKLVGNETFEDVTTQYRRFLMGVNMRVEHMARNVLLGMV